MTPLSSLPTAGSAQFRLQPPAPLAPPGLFAALLAGPPAAPAASPARLLLVGPPGVSVPGDAATRAAALARLTGDLSALAAGFGAAPEGGNAAAAAADVVALLRGFDATTGADAVRTLEQGLIALDPAGLAQLEAAAGDPAALVAALAGLLGLSLPVPIQMAPGAQAAASATSPGGPAGFSKPLEVAAPMPRPEPRQSLRLAGAEDAPPAATPEAPRQAAAQKPVLAEARAVSGAATVLAAISGSEAEVPTPPAAIEARASAAAPESARTPEAGLPPPAPGFARNLAQQIRGASFSEGHTRILLAPRGLGEIEIDLQPDEAGKLRIVLRADNPAVLLALRGDRDGLLAVLSEGGVGVEDADLSFEDFTGRRQREAEAEAARAAAPAPAAAPDDTPADAPATAVPLRRVAEDGSLDILT